MDCESVADAEPAVALHEVSGEELALPVIGVVLGPALRLALGVAREESDTGAELDTPALVLCEAAKFVGEPLLALAMVVAVVGAEGDT